jgi:hypothetical protein
MVQAVPLATEPAISIIILTPMKRLQWNLNRSTFIVCEMKRNVSVVCVCFSCNIFIGVRIIKEMPGLVCKWDTLYNVISFCDLWQTAKFPLLNGWTTFWSFLVYVTLNFGGDCNSCKIRFRSLLKFPFGWELTGQCLWSGDVGNCILCSILFCLWHQWGNFGQISLCKTGMSI